MCKLQDKYAGEISIKKQKEKHFNMDQTTTEQVYIYNTCPAKATKPLYLFFLNYITTLKKENKRLKKKKKATTLKINKTLNKNNNYF